MRRIRENTKKFVKKGGEKEVKKGLALSLLFTILLMFAPTITYATPILGSGVNELFFNNVENWVDNDTSGDISTGDLFYGILHVQDITVGGITIWNEDNVAPGIDTLTGYFLTEVTGFDTYGHIILGAASADPNGVLTGTELAADVVMKTWTDSSTAFESNGTVVDDISKATDGNPWLTLTIGGGYWWTDGPATPPPPGQFVGTSWIGLNIYANYTGAAFLPINDPNESLYDLDVDLYAKSLIFSQSGDWAFQSNDPAVVVPPEPTSLLLLGMGMIGLAGVGIRRKKRMA